MYVKLYILPRLMKPFAHAHHGFRDLILHGEQHTYIIVCYHRNAMVQIIARNG